MEVLVRQASVCLAWWQTISHGTGTKLRLLVYGIDDIVGVHHEGLVHGLGQVGGLARHVLVRAELLPRWLHQLADQRVLRVEHVLEVHLLQQLLLLIL